MPVQKTVWQQLDQVSCLQLDTFDGGQTAERRLVSDIRLESFEGTGTDALKAFDARLDKAAAVLQQAGFWDETLLRGGSNTNLLQLARTNSNTPPEVKISVMICTIRASSSCHLTVLKSGFNASAGTSGEPQNMQIGDGVLSCRLLSTVGHCVPCATFPVRSSTAGTICKACTDVASCCCPQSLGLQRRQGQGISTRELLLGGCSTRLSARAAVTCFSAFIVFYSHVAHIAACCETLMLVRRAPCGGLLVGHLHLPQPHRGGQRRRRQLPLPGPLP